MSGGVTDIDRGWAHLKSLLRSTQFTEAAVGLMADDDPRTDGEIGNVELGAVHEFGTQDGRIPERSFLRATFDANVAKYKRAIKRGLALLAAGRLDVKGLYSLIGQIHQADIRNAISAGVPPPNSESTVREKKSSRTLIDTGQLKQAIRFAVRGRS